MTNSGSDTFPFWGIYKKNSDRDSPVAVFPTKECCNIYLDLQREAYAFKFADPLGAEEIWGEDNFDIERVGVLGKRAILPYITPESMEMWD